MKSLTKLIAAGVFAISVGGAALAQSSMQHQNMDAAGMQKMMQEMMLNHVTGANKNDLDEIYDRYDYLEERREALQKWENRLQELLKRP